MIEILDIIIGWLRQSDQLVVIWRTIVFVFCALLFSLGILLIFNRHVAFRFLSGFGSTFALNSLEAVLRAIVGVAFLGVAPDSRVPLIFSAAGLIFIITALAIFLLPKVHKHYGAWSIDVIKRIYPVYAAVALALPIAIFFAVT